MFIFEAWLIQRSILQKLEIQFLHPNQVLIGAVADNIIGISQVPRSLWENRRMEHWSPIFISDADFFALLIAFKNEQHKSIPQETKISNVTRASRFSVVMCRILGRQTRILQQTPLCLVSKFSVRNKLSNAVENGRVQVKSTILLPSKHSYCLIARDVMAAMLVVT